MAIPLRADYSAAQLRSAAKASKDAAQVGAVTVQIVRDWVVK